MRYLLDTHAWLWMTTSPDRLGVQARSIIEDASNVRLLSTISVLEIVIKHRRGRLALPEPLERFVPLGVEATATTILPLTLSHSTGVAALPPHHSDPFDRVLIAQARTEVIALITSDRAFEAYDVELIPAS